jgi:Spy/CpxP family protein refolding chaperone
MSKKVFIFLLVILTVVNLAATTTILYERWSKEPPKPPGEWRGDMPPHPMRQRLDLTQEQIAQIEESRKAYWENVGPSIRQYREMHRTMMDELMSDNPDMNMIDSMVVQLGSMQTQIKRETIQHLMKDRQIFNQEQRRIMMRSFMEHMDREFDRPMMRGFGRGMDHRGKMHRRFFDNDSAQDRIENSNNKTLNGGAL